MSKHLFIVSAEKCKENWGKLRNAFLSAIKQRKTKSGPAATNITAWKYEDQMMFLRPFIEMRTTKTNLIPPSPESPLSQTAENSPSEFSNESENRESFSPNPRSSSVESQRSSSFKRSVSGNRKPDIGDIYELMKNNNAFRRERHQFKQDMDETDLFFLSMSKAVKALPKHEQTKIKLDLHKAISDAEIRQISKTEHVLNTPITITSQKIMSPRNQSRDQHPQAIPLCTSPSTSSSSRTYYFPTLPHLTTSQTYNSPPEQTCNSPPESESILNPRAQSSETTVEENVLVFYDEY